MKKKIGTISLTLSDKVELEFLDKSILNLSYKFIVLAIEHYITHILKETYASKKGKLKKDNKL